MNSNYIDTLNDTKKLEEAFAKAVGRAGIEETPEEPEVRTVIDLNIAMDAEAMKLVGNYVWEHLDRSDEEPKIEIYIVWKAKILKNWKYLISTNLNDGMYYELTLNGEKDEWYLDAYKKFENRRIPR